MLMQPGMATAAMARMETSRRKLRMDLSRLRRTAAIATPAADTGAARSLWWEERRAMRTLDLRLSE
jgi:hypothetical protein